MEVFIFIVAVMAISMLCGIFISALESFYAPIVGPIFAKIISTFLVVTSIMYVATKVLVR